jgi:RHS repeat-associated protein
LTNCFRAGGYAGSNYPFLTQKERDVETGLDYFLARYSSSIQGRFTSVDPDNAGAEPSNPQSWNAYGYTFNNPLKFQDPDGLKVRICGTDGQCTDGETDLSDEDFDKYFRHQKDIKIKDGKIYQNGEQIGTYQRLSCDECLFGTATFEIERRTAPIPKATAAFAGVSVAAGVTGGVALFALQPVTVTVTTLGLATRAAPLLPAVPSAIQKLEKLGLSLQQANAIIQSPASQKLIDNANGGNINVIQEIGGKLVRVTLDPTGQRIISAGIVRANSITNGIANGRFTPKQ